MAGKKGRLVITGKTAEEMLKETKAWVATLEKEVAEERRKTRTSGQILIGNALISAIADEAEKYKIFGQFIEIDSLLKNSKTSPGEKDEARRRRDRTVIRLAKYLLENMNKGKEAPSGKDDLHGKPDIGEQGSRSGDKEPCGSPT